MTLTPLQVFKHCPVPFNYRPPTSEARNWMMIRWFLNRCNKRRYRRV